MNLQNKPLPAVITINFVFPVVLFLFLTRCSNTIKSKSESDGLRPVRTVIAGKVMHLPEYDNSIMLIIDDIPTARQLINYSVINDKDSTFRFVFERYLPQTVMIKYYTLFDIFVHPGDSLFLLMKGNPKDDRISFLEKMEIYGDTIYFNELYYKYLKAENNTLSKSHKTFYDFQAKASPDEMRHYSDSILELKYGLLKRFNNRYNVPDELNTYLNVYILGGYVNSLSMFPLKYSIWHNVDKHKIVNSSYYDFVPLKLNEKELICPPVKSIINAYVMGYVDSRLFDKYKKEEGRVIDTVINGKRRYRIKNYDKYGLIRSIDKFTNDSLMIQLALCEMLGQRLEGMNYKYFEKNRYLFDKYVTTPWIRNSMLEYYQQVKYKCINPETATGLILKDLKNTPAGKILSGIIEKNKGKVIYLDCWETSCPPCLAEMPYAKKLMQKTDTSRVAFVDICFFSDKGAWKALIDKYQLNGQHYFADKNQSKYLSKAMSIHGFPNYLLFDKKGRLMEQGTELRPSNTETKNKINALIKL